MLIGLTILVLVDAPAFAEVSPGLGNAAASIKDPGIQLAEANPPGIGSVDDYMRQDNDGPSSAGVPPQRYSMPAPQPQTVPPQEWNYRYADPNGARNALIGAAVVGAVAVGLWALQQHELHQAQRRARRRYYAERPAYPY